MRTATLLDSTAFGLTVRRLCYQLVEDHGDLSDTVLLGLQPRGVYLSRRLVRDLGGILGGAPVAAGELDITFHRDDFRRRPTPLAPNAMHMDLRIEGRRVVLIDDVLYTGRSIRAGLDALMTFGRPASVQLLVLIDRRFARELPIAADYVGRWVDSIEGQRVTVEWAETDGRDRVIMHRADHGAPRGAHHQTSTGQ